MTVHHDHGSTIVREDREGPATALIVVLALFLVAFLVWFFAFSGVVFDRSPEGGTQTNVEQNTGDTGNTNPYNVPSVPSS